MPSARPVYLNIVRPGEPTPWTDAQLVAALIAGEPLAPVRTWRQYSPRIFRIVERTLGLASDAEDITQDIFLRVFARVHTLRDPEAFGSFVVSVALRVIKAHLRRKRVRQILHIVSEVPDQPIPGVDWEGRRSLRRFYEVLDTLPANQRLIFALRHLEEMTLTEVAAATGTSLATVKRKLRKATEQLAKKMMREPLLAEYALKGRPDGD
jgi:RNA polymerase sigma-70 factor (ECF subfamily)